MNEAGPHPAPATKTNILKSMKKFKTILGTALFIIGFVLSSAEKPDGSPAPLVTLGAASVMLIGGNMLSKQFKNEGDE